MTARPPAARERSTVEGPQGPTPLTMKKNNPAALAAAFASALTAVTALTALTATPAQAAPEGLSVGFGTHVWFSEYKGVDDVVYPLPLINWEGERLYVHGIEAGAYLFKNAQHEVTLGVGLMPLSFDASDSDDRRVKRLDDRKLSASANLGYALNTEFGRFQAILGVDVLGRSDGILFTGIYSYPMSFGCTQVIPSVAVTYADANFNDYYYGISAKESARSGLAAYDAGASVTPMLGLHVIHSFDEHWSVYGSSSLTILAKEAKDSPMVEDKVRFGVGAGVTYRF